MDKNFFKETEENFIYFHSHPEPSSQEYNTTDYIRKKLIEYGIKIIETGLETGLVAVIGREKRKKAAVRCDIDALRIQEATNLPYKSENQGIMHACGHDFHMACILGAAKLLKENEDKLEGSIYVIFQPAEENATGALKVLDTGILDDVQVIFGIHVNPEYNPGTIGIHTGGATASVERFRMRITGKGCHGAMPHQGTDPITIASQVITSWQTMISRCIDAIYPAVISVTQIHAGTTWNVIPQSVDIEGTVRTNNNNIREQVMNKMRSIAEGEAAVWGAEAKLEFIMGHPATDNDTFWSKFAMDTAVDYGFEAIETRPLMIGEDFAYYQQKLPGVLIWVGAGKTMPLHHPGLKLDPKAVAPNAEYVYELVSKALKKL